MIRPINFQIIHLNIILNDTMKEKKLLKSDSTEIFHKRFKSKICLQKVIYIYNLCCAYKDCPSSLQILENSPLHFQIYFFLLTRNVNKGIKTQRTIKIKLPLQYCMKCLTIMSGQSELFQLTNRKTGRKHVNKLISRPFVNKISRMVC